MLMGFRAGRRAVQPPAESAPHRRLPTAAARFYAASVLLALEHLHARSILYR